jgi:4,5-DOPA dioxygenase extradiol
MVPALFISHGSPTLAIEQNEYTEFLKELGKSIKPKAIVIFTAHWENDITTISGRDNAYEMIYDFGGFSEELYSIRYAAKGSNRVALSVHEKLAASGIESKIDTNRGLDHGAWVILSLMYPKADIPIVQISINPWLSPEMQYKIGEAIKSLGEEDILVIGSGGTVHNLRTIKWEGEKPEMWAVEFDNWIADKLENMDINSLFSYSQLAPNSKMAVPREEHLMPLFIALGSGNDRKAPKVLHRSYAYGTLSQICFEF